MIERYLRLTAYVAVLTLCLMRGWEYVHDPSREIQSARADPHSALASIVGKRLDITDHSWGARRATLVFALSTRCHFCSESADFYRKIVLEVIPAMPVSIGTVALMPESDTASLAYARDTLGIRFDKISHEVPHKIVGTPTVLLVDQSGIVMNAWLGKLSAIQESELIQAVSRL